MSNAVKTLLGISQCYDLVQTIINLRSLSIEKNHISKYIPEAGAVVAAEAAATVAAWVTARLVLYTVGFLSNASFYNHIQKLLVYLQPKKYIFQIQL